MLTILKIIRSIVGLGDTVKGISHDIASAKIKAIEAGTEEKRIEAEENVKGLEARRDVLVEESRNSAVNGWIRAVLAMPAAIVLWKVLVYDKALGQWTGGRTDQLSDELWQVVMMVLGFYFVFEISRVWRR